MGLGQHQAVLGLLGFKLGDPPDHLHHLGRIAAFLEQRGELQAQGEVVGIALDALLDNLDRGGGIAGEQRRFRLELHDQHVVRIDGERLVETRPVPRIVALALFQHRVDGQGIDVLRLTLEHLAYLFSGLVQGVAAQVQLGQFHAGIDLVRVDLDRATQLADRRPDLLELEQCAAKLVTRGGKLGVDLQYVLVFDARLLEIALIEVRLGLLHVRGDPIFTTATTGIEQHRGCQENH